MNLFFVMFEFMMKGVCMIFWYFLLSFLRWKFDVWFGIASFFLLDMVPMSNGGECYALTNRHPSISGEIQSAVPFLN